MSDVESLLEPISDERPGGEDIFYGDDFAELTAFRELRDKSAERRWTPDWDGVADVAERILTEQSKDIRVALYLAEAWLNTQGFGGFQSGLGLVLQLLQRFPEAAHPTEADDRAYALDFLVGALQADSRQMPEVVRAVELFPLTDWGHHFHDYQLWKSAKPAKTKEGGKGAAAEADDSGNPTPANFGKALVETSKAYYKDLSAAIPTCIDTLSALEAWGKEYFDGKVDSRETPVPRYSRLSAELKNVKDAVADLLARKLVDDPDPVVASRPAASAPGEGAGGADGSTPGAPSSGGISAEPRDAEDATERVMAAARFLRRAAPTDPGPYMMIRGLRWGELRSGGTLNKRLLEPPDTSLRRRLTGLLVDESWDELLDAGEEVMGMACGRGWLDLQRYVVTALDNLGPDYRPVSEAIRGQLSALLADLPELLEYSMMDDMPTANAQTRAWLDLAGIIRGRGDGAGAGEGEGGAEHDRERTLSEATHERALAMAATGNARRGIEMLMKRADREESARARFITESLAASVMVDAGMVAVAKPMLEDLEKLIEARKLAEWESAEIVARPLGLLYRCLQPNDRKRTELYDKICRLDPVHAMTLDNQGQQTPAAKGGQAFQPSQPASPTRGQPVQPNEPAKPSQQGEAVDSGSIDSNQGTAS